MDLTGLLHSRAVQKTGTVKMTSNLFRHGDFHVFDNRWQDINDSRHLVVTIVAARTVGHNPCRPFS